MSRNPRVYPANARCAICGDPGSNDDPLTRGHIIPRSLGGPDRLWNIRPEHASCNQRRGDVCTRDDAIEAWERMTGVRELGPRPVPIRMAPASVEKPRWDNQPMPAEWFASFSASR